MQTCPAELERTIEHRIEARTFRQVQNLRVELVDGQITVHGSTRSHYVKLLALEAIREVRDLICPIALMLDIEVS